MVVVVVDTIPVWVSLAAVAVAAVLSLLLFTDVVQIMVDIRVVRVTKARMAVEVTPIKALLRLVVMVAARRTLGRQVM
jgi:hypothetical protein